MEARNYFLYSEPESFYPIDIKLSDDKNDIPIYLGSPFHGYPCADKDCNNS